MHDRNEGGLIAAWRAGLVVVGVVSAIGCITPGGGGGAGDGAVVVDATVSVDGGQRGVPDTEPGSDLGRPDRDADGSRVDVGPDARPPSDARPDGPSGAAPDAMVEPDHGGGPDAMVASDAGPCSCGERVCGSDGCGGECGVCPAGVACTVDGRCAAPTCGDGQCRAPEDCALCPADCGACCGDGHCVAAHGERCDTCPADCGCPEGMPCRDGACHCANRCSNSDLLVCVDGPAWDRQQCVFGCGGLPAACHPVCDPSQRETCIDGESMICEGGDRWVPNEKCPDGCDASGCLPRVRCEAGARRCTQDGQQLYVCAEDGRSEQFIDCEHRCVDDGPGPRCRPPCAPGETRCADEGRVQACRPDGSGWQAAEPCDGICIVPEGRCGVGGACRPGDFGCQPEGRVHCDAQGAGMRATDDEEDDCPGICTAQNGLCPLTYEGSVTEVDGLLWVHGPAGWGGVATIDEAGRQSACTAMGYEAEGGRQSIARGALGDEPVRYTVGCAGEVSWDLEHCEIALSPSMDGVELGCAPVARGPFACRGLPPDLKPASLYRLPDGTIRPVACRGCSGRLCTATRTPGGCTEGDWCEAEPGQAVSLRWLSDDRPGRIELSLAADTTVEFIGSQRSGEAPCRGEVTLTISQGDMPFAVVGPSPCGQIDQQMDLPQGGYRIVVTTTSGREYSLRVELPIVW